MSEPRSVVETLVADDKLEEALNELEKLVPPSDKALSREVISLRQRVSSARKRRRQGLSSMDADVRTRTELGDSILQVLEDIAEAPPASAATSGHSRRPLVFVSYNHEDREVADKLKTALEAHGLLTRIDHADIGAGESIRRFIGRSVRESDLTVSVVSRRSLPRRGLPSRNAQDAVGRIRRERGGSSPRASTTTSSTIAIVSRPPGRSTRG
jgi:hypothetical protein